MIVQDNEEIRKQIKNLVRTIDDAADCIEGLTRLADAKTGEVDAVDEVAEFDKIIFNMRAVMFNAKISLEKIQKSMHKHVAHTLNPIAKTAPKEEKRNSARKKKDAVVGNKASLPNDYVNDLTKALNTIVKNTTEFKHSTINRNMIPKGDVDNSNSAHDRPFDEADEDLPF